MSDSRWFKSVTRPEFSARGNGVAILVFGPEGFDRPAGSFRVSDGMLLWAGGRPDPRLDTGYYAEEWGLVAGADGTLTEEGAELLDEFGLDLRTVLRREERAESEVVILREEERSRIERERDRMSAGAAVAAAVRRWLRAQTVEGYAGIQFGGIYGRGRDAAGNRVYLHRNDRVGPFRLGRYGVFPTYGWTVVYEGLEWAYEFVEWWAEYGPAEIELDPLSSYEIGVTELDR